MSVKVKVAFQGGGAKLLPMLAVAEAMQELESNGEIEIELLAGTSSGAITTSIMSQRYDARQFANILVANADDYIKKIDGFSKRKWIAITQLLWALLRGRPVGKIDQLKDVLSDSFCRIDPNFSANKKIGAQGCIPLRLVAADIVGVETKVTCSSANANDRLLDAVIDSCALPVFFRSVDSVKSGKNEVDGGLYCNLPIEQLMPQPEDNVIGVSFENPSKHPVIKGMIHYLGHLLLSTIDNSVKKSSELIAEDDIHRIRTSLNTLDFADAALWVPGQNDYETVRENALKWLREYISKKNRTQRRRTIKDVLRDNGDVLDGFINSCERKNLICGITATINVLAPLGDERHRYYTEVKTRQRFSCSDGLVSCCGMSASEMSQVDSLSEFYFHVIDQDRNSIPFKQVPALRQIEVEGEVNEFLVTGIYFDEPLTPSASGQELWYEVTKTDYERDGMIELSPNEESTGDDNYIGITNSQQNPFDEAYVIVHVPVEFYDIVAESKYGSDIIELDNIQLFELGGQTPGGFKSFGWLTRDFKSNQDFYLDLKIVE